MNLSKIDGDGQSVPAGAVAPSPLIVRCDSATAAFCPNVAGIVVNYEVSGTCATLENLSTGDTGYSVTALIEDESNRLSQDVEVTVGLATGDCFIDAHVQYLDPDGGSLGEARVTFTLAIN